MAGQIALLELGDATPPVSVRDQAHGAIAIGSAQPVRVLVPGDAMSECETSQAVLASEKHRCLSDDHGAYEAYHRHDRDHAWTQNHLSWIALGLVTFLSVWSTLRMVPIQGRQRNILVVNFSKEMWHLEANRRFVDHILCRARHCLGDNACTVQRTPGPRRCSEPALTREISLRFL